MNILCIDTCQQGLALAIKTDSNWITHVDEDYRTQATNLLPSLTALLAKAHIRLADIDLLGVTQGPGAFTGLRVGISAAQGLSLAKRIPIVAVSSLQWIAQTAFRVHACQQVTVARDARMHAIYWGRYFLSNSAIMVAEQPERLSAIDVLHDIALTSVVAGDAWQTYHTQLPNCAHTGVLWGELIDLLTLVEAAWLAGDYHQAETLVPVYLRDDVVS